MNKVNHHQYVVYKNKLFNSYCHELHSNMVAHYNPQLFLHELTSNAKSPFCVDYECNRSCKAYFVSCFTYRHYRSHPVLVSRSVYISRNKTTPVLSRPTAQSSSEGHPPIALNIDPTTPPPRRTARAHTHTPTNILTHEY